MGDVIEKCRRHHFLTNKQSSTLYGKQERFYKDFSIVAKKPPSLKAKGIARVVFSIGRQSVEAT